MTDSITIVLPHWALPMTASLLLMAFFLPWVLLLRATHATHEARMETLSARGVIQQLEVMNMMYRHVDEATHRGKNVEINRTPPPPPPPANTNPSIGIKG